jgi:glycosyltransferase involved in cell wall biosynthesis
MKVIMLGWELPPHNSGGLGVACYQLAKSLANNGADISFIIPYSADVQTDFMRVLSTNVASPERLLGIYDSSQGNTKTVETDNLSLHELQDLYADRASNIVEASEYDVIHAHDWLTFRAGIRLKELSGRPLVVHVHSIESDRAGDKPGNPIVHEIESTGMHLADQIIAVSEFTKQKIIRDYHIPADKITVAHNSIDLSELVPLDDNNTYRYLKELKKRGYTIVVNVGRHTLQKGLSHLLGAAARVVDLEPKTIFLFVGDGDQHRELITQSAELGISRNVLFAGFQRGKPWRDSFGIADLFVMPSVSEPFGLTPLEAALYDTPSLVSKQSGVSEVLHCCLKVDYWDEHKTTEQIVSFIRHLGLRDELLTGVKTELLGHSWQKSARKLLETYQLLTRGTPA